MALLQESKNWNLYTAKHVISEIKEMAELEFDWQISKDDIEETIMIMDSEYRIYGSFYSAVRAAVKDQWKYLKEYASRQLWLATIAAEVEKEKESNNKKAEEKAI
jgi:translation initiation factor 2 alpha subunit (eIF-2alpha)